MAKLEQPQAEQEQALPRQEVAPGSPEQAEIRVERRSESVASVERAPDTAVSLPVTSSTAPAPVAPPKDAGLLKVERIMEDGLLDAYLKMSPAARTKFKFEGEVTAQKISQMLARSAVKAKQVFRLIWNWLKKISGVNRYWLQQEAKIKTDKVMHMAEARQDSDKQK